MLEVLVLDSFLILILLLLVPVGMYRGGLREVCSAAGLLLGLVVANEWSNRWGNWVSSTTSVDEGVSKFVVAVATMVLFTALIGYGAAASFSYSPGPGGRLYGGLISLLTGVIFLGALIQFVSTYLYDGVYPDIIRDGYVSRALSVGFDWVLLTVAMTVVLASLFGMIVRERDTGDIVGEIPREAGRVSRRPVPVPAMAPEPDTLEPEALAGAAASMAQTSAVKIREVRHWEEKTPPTVQDLQSGWTRTWPSSVTADADKVPWSKGTSPPARPARPRAAAKQTQEEDVIRDWLAADQETRSRKPPRPNDDE